MFFLKRTSSIVGNAMFHKASEVQAIRAKTFTPRLDINLVTKSFVGSTIFLFVCKPLFLSSFRLL